MDKFQYCTWAHEHKDELMGMMMNDEPITTEHMIKFLVLSEICNQSIMEMQREKVWQPLNSHLAAADGIHTVMLSHDMPMMKDLHGKDMHKAVKHMMSYFEKMKTADPTRFQAFLAEID